ncbi:hypothetical protein SAMN05216489_00002 [Streptomyces sp. 3213]|uniref:hypothetical protein n=1 Tax=Streptomyces sp. 3213.3 TaxID=1855348 RepID=UPI00089502A3|nr:hypothetical protein [Streptomyces sp. 3213.3]SEC14600.1 hypothetical protein SAMN05216489_00002 [Streptomyces sp. 3213] [Streptomyces sp. 3213.3]
MTTDDHHPTAPGAAPKGSKRASAQEVIQFVIAEKRLADLDVEIDFEALARLDDMPDDEAAALIDETMARILFT